MLGVTVTYITFNGDLVCLDPPLNILISSGPSLRVQGQRCKWPPSGPAQIQASVVALRQERQGRGRRGPPGRHQLRGLRRRRLVELAGPPTATSLFSPHLRNPSPSTPNVPNGIVHNHDQQLLTSLKTTTATTK